MASTGGTTKYKPVDLIPLEQMLAPRDTSRAATKAKLYAASLDPGAWETKNLLPVAVNRYSGEQHLAVPQYVQDIVRRMAILGQMAVGQSPTGNAADDYAIALQTTPQTVLDVGLLGAPVPRPAGSLGMFAGITAKTADKEALKLAQHMEASGIPREEIWKRTGWYKAPDGHWKFEIDDSRAFFRDYAMPKADPFGKDKVVYDYLTKKGYQLEKDPISGGIRNTPANHDAVTPEDMTAAWEYAAANPPKPPETALRNVLTHDELFKAYPELGNIPVSPETSGTVYGSFDGKKITMGGGVINPKVNPLSTTLHEGQHYIEEVENFGRGGNTEFVMRHPDPVVQEAYNRRFDQRFNFAPIDEWQQTYASRLAGKPDDEILRLYEMQKNFMEGRKYDPKDQLTIDARRDAAAGTYRDLAGEAEARNTQARMKMSAKERRETPPWMTLDVPEHAHITTFETPYGGANAELPVQAISSAKTSLRQVPALLKSKVFDAAPGSRNLDLGGGAYDMGTEYLANERGVKSYVLDPFNRPDEHNRAVAEMFKKDPADTVTVANVLNVIKEPEARLGVIKQAYDNVKPGGKVYFDIYEGNRSGTGAVTSKGFQNNASAQFYLDEIKKMFPDVQRKGTVLIATKPMAAR